MIDFRNNDSRKQVYKKLMFDEIGAKAQHFIENRPGHGPETLSAHFLLADTHAPQGREEGILDFVVS